MTAGALELLPVQPLSQALVEACGDARWLQTTAELISGGKSNLTFTLCSPAGELVLRRPPTGTLLPSAHDMAREDLIAQSRIEIDQARLHVCHAAWLIDRYGAQGARSEISAIKVSAPAMATQVIDRAIEIFGGMGVSNDIRLAYFYAWARVLRIVDGPDAVHRRTIARLEMKKTAPYVG
ncbi:hypothetical protein GCM10009555_056240 [Acrocarpospora macrocephala]|uniref:Acyl-CoA dehydrogenase/oxidase C-terminal domain-containing protein n=1 Tax=Acrocarpospora macrocephala TaxID=150177 RepID=A0A5M3WJD7_9ACTN|nr:acyl-CoA dehydrogenase family protein [Acrocarpospora macrocephala]GES08490.1 hypothetical protein Amac_020860 [Acrocarpospora macrocephala]